MGKHTAQSRTGAFKGPNGDLYERASWEGMDDYPGTMLELNGTILVGDLTITANREYIITVDEDREYFLGRKLSITVPVPGLWTLYRKVGVK